MVWPGFYQFVSLFEGDGALPIPGQRPARPNRHEQSGHANHGTGDVRPIRAPGSSTRFSSGGRPGFISRT